MLSCDIPSTRISPATSTKAIFFLGPKNHVPKTFTSLFPPPKAVFFRTYFLNPKKIRNISPSTTANIDIIFIPDGIISIGFPVGRESFKEKPVLSFVVIFVLDLFKTTSFLSSSELDKAAFLIWSTRGATPIPARLTFISED